MRLSTRISADHDSLPPLYCAECAMPIEVGEDYIEYEGEVYCSPLCLIEQLERDELIVAKTHGTEVEL